MFLWMQTYALEIQTSDPIELQLDYIREALRKAGGADYGTGVRDWDEARLVEKHLMLLLMHSLRLLFYYRNDYNHREHSYW